MQEDMRFHSSLIRHLPRHLQQHQGLGRKTQIVSALVLWQLANAAGFFREAAAPRA
jgi:hypothetical protein